MSVHARVCYNWERQPDLSGMVQYFSLITNQRTLPFSLVFQRNKHGLRLSFTLNHLNMINVIHTINIQAVRMMVSTTDKPAKVYLL
jgi:hypothetical protein